jgi:hypothetical protein
MPHTMDPRGRGWGGFNWLKHKIVSYLVTHNGSTGYGWGVCVGGGVELDEQR